jgi:putative transposase
VEVEAIKIPSEEQHRAARTRRGRKSNIDHRVSISKITLSVPRDRAGTFGPKLIAKYQRPLPDFD